VEDWANNTLGADSQGAETVEVVVGGHLGGTVKEEPYHLNVRIRKGNGGLIRTTNPHTGEKTKTWHVYEIAENEEDLYKKAKEWDDAQNLQSSGAVGAEAEVLAQSEQPGEGVSDDKKNAVGDGGGGPEDDDSRSRAAAPGMDDQSTRDDPGSVTEPLPPCLATSTPYGSISRLGACRVRSSVHTR